MAYVVETNVESELSVDITATTSPTSTELTEFITQIEAEFNGVLHSIRVTVPIVKANSPIAFEIATQTALWGVCSRTLNAYGGVILDQSPKAQLYWDRYKAKLEEIKNNPDILYDASALTSDSSLMVDGIVDGDDEYHEPAFTMIDVF